MSNPSYGMHLSKFSVVCADAEELDPIIERR
jgi:hypothetical protein